MQAGCLVQAITLALVGSNLAFAEPSDESAHTDVDLRVIDTVLHDMVTVNSEEIGFVIGLMGKPPRRIRFAKNNIPDFSPGTLNLLKAEHKTSPLKHSRIDEAMKNAQSREKTGEVFSEYRPSTEFIHTLERWEMWHPLANAAPRFEQNAVQAWPPGYSNDGTYAIVSLSLTRGHHGSTGLYVLHRNDGEWEVVYRKFESYW